MKVMSFDVFDTLLTRVTGQPGAIFLFLGRQLAQEGLLPCSPEVFARLRSEAEQRAFENAGGLDSHVDLARIYEELGVVLGLDASQRQMMMKAELELETRFLRPIPAMAERLVRLRASGQRVVFTSDMYLSAQTILEWLAAHGLATSDDTCYASSDYGRAKVSGALFDLLVQREGVAPKEVLHIGNNARADFRGAKMAGLQAELVTDGNLNRYEEALSHFTYATDGLAALLAGASRLTRLALPAATAHQRALRDISAGVAAPLLVGFTLWILSEAQRLGLRRLYFAARDGQMVLELAKRIAPKLGLEVDLRYLYSSRQAWCLPAITADEQLLLQRILSTYELKSLEFLSVEGLLHRVNIRPEEIAAHLVAVQLHPDDWQRNLTVAERLAVQKALFKDPFLNALIVERASEARALLLTYLQQEGMLDGTPFALVDLGTGGTLHIALELVLATVGMSPLTSFYLGFTNEPTHHTGKLLPYLFARHTGMGFPNVMGLVQLVEIVCTADHGTVLGFQHNGAQVVPILQEQFNTAAYAWGYAFVRETICHFADVLELSPDLVNVRVDVRPAAVEAISHFWRHPTREEAVAWGAFPFDDGWGKELFFSPLARPYQWSDLPRILRTGHMAHPRHNWQRGSLVLTHSRVLRNLLRALLTLHEAIKSSRTKRGLRLLRRWVQRLIRIPQGIMPVEHPKS
ncbi:HAD family hydrolase [Candidatus Chloroploca sp. Khr17]|uniref:HAD family hydrolase n=1 Tax=Candidatus Chloroploca sp. Khr17 TaxID=2496869 RepID=UPI0013EE3348|nr:HAD family hydrolase [Candidatus Chloroploca sp. Khr17]